MAHGGARHPVETGNPTWHSHPRRGGLRLAEYYRVMCAIQERSTVGCGLGHVALRKLDDWVAHGGACQNPTYHTRP